MIHRMVLELKRGSNTGFIIIIFFSFCEHFTLDLIYVISISFSWIINHCGNSKCLNARAGRRSVHRSIIDFDVHSFDVAY